VNAKNESLPAPRPVSVAGDESRYVIERLIGQGGAGAVFLAKDRETGEQVALKRLFRMDAKSILRLKREFRSLIGINHPHIIKLYDMGRAHDGWFLTMEYVEGLDLATYLSVSEAAIQRTGAEVPLQRILACFTQLARGIHALHQAGMLHRDLKPSNVLVVDHRVVVLDFGLVRELSLSAATVTEDGAVAGTPAYMAPEQLLGKELDVACDWYAFGAMLYEALSGDLPISGSLCEILRRKLDTDPTPIHEFAPDTPAELAELCMALLQRDPARRPGAERILAALDRGTHASATALPHTLTETTFATESETRAVANVLFGRQSELGALREAYAEAAAGNAVVVHVCGPSGVGKSALVARFVADLDEPTATAQGADALVLRSRCYELEAMPFKALDGVIDALVRHLSLLDDFAVAHLLPPELGALTRQFPVFERLSVVKRLLVYDKPERDAVLDRQRAQGALRALLETLAMRKPIVVWIDDLQWGDLDSARSSGRFEQSEALLNQVFADMGIRVPHGERAVRAALVWERMRLRVRGLNYRLREPQDAPPELLARHDLFESVGSVLTQYDSLRASLFQLRGLHCALDAGEPGRLVHGLCRVAISASLSATPKAASEAAALLERADKLARQSAAQTLGVVDSTRIIMSYFLGRHAEVVALSVPYLNDIRTDTRAETRGNYYRRNLVAAMRVGSLQVLGRYSQSIVELTPLVDEASATDNRSLFHHLAAAQALAEEIVDDCKDAQSRLDRQRDELPKNHFGTHHALHMSALLGAACLTRNYAWAHECLDANWQRYLRSPIDRGSWVSITLRASRARLLLNQHIVEGQDPRLLSAARQDLSWLERHGASAFAKRVAARVAHQCGDDAQAIGYLRDVIAQLEQRSMLGEAARDRYALGALLGGEQGRALTETARHDLTALGVVNPAALLRAHYPEFVEAG
jgi:hypothetical protein